VVDDKTQYIDWDKKADIKAQLKVQIILTLAKHKYPPATRDDVFKAIFEQAENFKRNRPVVVHNMMTYQLDEVSPLPFAAEDETN
jgi:type I restriction enzyme R subunit